MANFLQKCLGLLFQNAFADTVTHGGLPDPVPVSFDPPGSKQTAEDLGEGPSGGGVSGASAVKTEEESSEDEPMDSSNRGLREELKSRSSFVSEGSNGVKIKGKSFSLSLKALLELTLTQKTVPESSRQGFQAFLKYLVSEDLDHYIKNEKACAFFKWYAI